MQPPWISRKMSFLIDKMGLSREIAKALIINSAFGWETDNAEKDYKGYGVVPTKISDVLMGRNEEIKFFKELNPLIKIHKVRLTMLLLMSMVPEHCLENGIM